MGEVLEYRSGRVVKGGRGRWAAWGGTGGFRRVAFWGNLVPLVLGAGGFLVAWGSDVDGVMVVCVLALMWSVVSVPGGVGVLIVHLVWGCPEGDGRRRVGRAVLAWGVVLAVWPAAFGCMQLMGWLEEGHLRVVNVSGAAVSVWDGGYGGRRQGGPGGVGGAGGTLQPGEWYEIVYDSDDQGPFPDVSAMVAGGKLVTFSPVRGRFQPLRGYRVEWDGVGWRQVR